LFDKSKNLRFYRRYDDISINPSSELNLEEGYDRKRLLEKIPEREKNMKMGKRGLWKSNIYHKSKEYI